MPPRALPLIEQRLRETHLACVNERSITLLAKLVQLSSAHAKNNDGTIDGDARDEKEKSLVTMMTPELLLDAGNIAGLFDLIHDLIKRQFTDSINIPEKMATGEHRSLGLRVSVAILQRRAELDYDDDPGEVPYIVQQFIRRRDRQRSIGFENNDQETANSNIQSGSRQHQADAPRFHLDASRVMRAVESNFTGDGDEAKFSGDLTSAPAFDMWEKRVRSQFKKFDGLSASQEVSFLEHALTEDALRFFHEKIAPQDGRYGRTRDDAARESASNLSLAPNAQTLSASMLLLQTTFCTDSARGVLRETLQNTRLGTIQKENACDKAAGLKILLRRIQRYTANGPPDYRSERCQIDYLSDALKGEKWAMDTFIACEQDKQHVKVGQYVDTLTLFLHKQTSFDPETAVINNAGMEREQNDDETSDSFYGETRATRRAPQRRGSSPARPGRFRRPQRSQSLHSLEDLLRVRSPRSPSTLTPNPPHSIALPPPRGRSLSRSPSMTSIRERARSTDCFRCGREGHYARDCTFTERTMLADCRAYLTDGSGTAEELVSVLAAHYDDGDRHDEDSLYQTAADEEHDVDGVTDDEQAAVAGLYSAFYQASETSSHF